MDRCGCASDLAAGEVCGIAQSGDGHRGLYPEPGPFEEVGTRDRPACTLEVVSTRPREAISLTLWMVGVIGSGTLGCSGGVRPYRAMAKAAASEESVEGRPTTRDSPVDLDTRSATRGVERTGFAVAAVRGQTVFRVRIARSCAGLRERSQRGERLPRRARRPLVLLASRMSGRRLRLGHRLMGRIRSMGSIRGAQIHDPVRDISPRRGKAPHLCGHADTFDRSTAGTPRAYFGPEGGTELRGEVNGEADRHGSRYRSPDRGA